MGLNIAVNMIFLRVKHKVNISEELQHFQNYLFLQDIRKIVFLRPMKRPIKCRISEIIHGNIDLNGNIVILQKNASIAYKMEFYIYKKQDFFLLFMIHFDTI